MKKIHTARSVIAVTRLEIENGHYPLCVDGYDDCAEF